MAMNREDELGAMWVREGRSGEFMSGKLTIDGVSIDVVMFQNTHKQPGERSPDWRIYKSQPREGQAPQQQARPQQQRRAAPAPVDLDDSIPF